MTTLISYIRKKLKNISDLISELNKNITKPIKNEEVWLERLKNDELFLNWTIKKYKLQFSGSPNKVFIREIFYCKLGFNIGSEQGGERPVVILQNDAGNAKSTVTIIAPITTIKGVIEKTENGYIIKSIDKNGKEKVKNLDIDIEIPIEIEDIYKKKITGFIDIGQIRTISKKRLDKAPVAKITTETHRKILQGFIKIFEINLQKEDS